MPRAPIDDPRGVEQVDEFAESDLGQVRNYLFKARERSLLTSAGPGRAGGELTDKAKEILDGER
jgi:hypothetical protein